MILALHLRDRDGSAELRVRVSTRSARPGIDGAHDGALRVRVKAAPSGGKANREVVRTVAAAIGLPPSSVAIIRGTTARAKTLAIAGMTAEDVAKRLERAD